MGRYDLVVLGDVNMDYVVARSLSFPLSSVRENGLIYWEDIEEVPGGSGLNLCAFAAGAGHECLMLGKVGNDAAGAVITAWLTARGVGRPARWTDASPTGKALIMRDSAGVRLIINNRVNANHSLSVPDVEENAPALASCQVLYVSGYCVMDPGAARHDAALRAMTLARSGDQPPAIVFDVVPHRIHETVSFDRFRENTRNVDILISEVATMRRFLGLGSAGENIDAAMALQTAELVAGFYPRAALRYGPSGCDHEVLMDTGAGLLVQHATGHRQVSDKRGYGDRLALSALQEFFHVLPAATGAGRPAAGRGDFSTGTGPGG